MAQTDENKLKLLASVARRLSNLQNVAILYENSVFGGQICRNHLSQESSRTTQPSDTRGPTLPLSMRGTRDSPPATARALCDAALQVSFSANIADVRFGLREKKAEQAKAQGKELPIPSLQQHLSLQDGAENGSEFPESQEPPLTVVSTDLQLRQIGSRLAERGSNIVAVIATDVRDRLFLFEQLRSELPNALLVDFATDNLLGHEDFIHASRGALTLGSADLIRCGTRDSGDADSCATGAVGNPDQGGMLFSAFATEEQALIEGAVLHWPAAKEPPTGAPSCMTPSCSNNVQSPHLFPNVVTAKGMIPVGAQEDLTRVNMLLCVLPVLAFIAVLCWAVSNTAVQAQSLPVAVVVPQPTFIGLIGWAVAIGIFIWLCKSWAFAGLETKDPGDLRPDSGSSSGDGFQPGQARGSGRAFTVDNICWTVVFVRRDPHHGTSRCRQPDDQEQLARTEQDLGCWPSPPVQHPRASPRRAPPTV